VTGFLNDIMTFKPKTGFSGLGSFKYTLENGVCSSSIGTGFVGVNLPAPTVTSVSPKVGPAAGGTMVTITGSNLTNGAAPLTVTFGGDPAILVSSGATSLVVKTPACRRSDRRPGRHTGIGQRVAEQWIPLSVMDAGTRSESKRLCLLPARTTRRRGMR